MKVDIFNMAEKIEVIVEYTDCRRIWVMKRVMRRRDQIMRKVSISMLLIPKFYVILVNRNILRTLLKINYFGRWCLGSSYHT